MADDDQVEDQNTDVDADQVDDATEGSDQLGDAGKKALDAMKAKWQKERDERKALAARIAELEKGKPAGDDQQPTAEKLREEARAEARAEALKDRALDKIEARAAKLFADPEDAAAFLSRRVDDFIDGGKLDVDAIDEALAELLQKKPHLAAQGGTGKRFSGTADGGTRNGSGRPAQLTEQDLKRMTPEAIVKARQEGRLNDLLGVT
jgi:hypothetical protein